MLEANPLIPIASIAVMALLRLMVGASAMTKPIDQQRYTKALRISKNTSSSQRGG